ALAEEIRARAVVGVGVVSAARVDRDGILAASLEAMRRAVAAACCREGPPDLILVDGREPIRPAPFRAVPQRTLVQGDARAVCVAAASVVAKVHRDRLMVAYDRRYPGYGFHLHKGYASPEHLEALRRHGPTPIHRRSFRGVDEAGGGRR
ncbi:MAG: ribonuclease HII, partial [Deltaproteobacteria bacterium]